MVKKNRGSIDPINNRFAIQDDKYIFPYHFIPHFDDRGNGVRCRFLGWGYEYLCYMMHVKHIVDELDPNSILDAGCGDGRLFSLLSGSISRRVGVDLSNKAIRFAYAFNPNVDFILGDIRDINEVFDVVTLVEVLEHIPDKEVSDFIKGVEDKIDELGHLVISVPSKVKDLNPKHYRHYDLDLLCDQVISSANRLRLVRGDYIYKKALIIDVWKKITNNRLWTAEVKFMGKHIWKMVWNKMRYASSKDGLHVVAIFQKQ